MTFRDIDLINNELYRLEPCIVQPAFDRVEPYIITNKNVAKLWLSADSVEGFLWDVFYQLEGTKPWVQLVCYEWFFANTYLSESIKNGPNIICKKYSLPFFDEYDEPYERSTLTMLSDSEKIPIPLEDICDTYIIANNSWQWKRFCEGTSKYLEFWNDMKINLKGEFTLRAVKGYRPYKFDKKGDRLLRGGDKKPKRYNDIHVCKGNWKGVRNYYEDGIEERILFYDADASQ